MRPLLRIAFLIALPVFASAQSIPYRVLLPVWTPDPVAGAFGSRWQTEFAAFNPTTTTYLIAFCGATGCPRIGVENDYLRPNQTITALPELPELASAYRGPGPRLLYLDPAADASSLVFQLRAADRSRSATNAGTEVPVVKQEQFRRTTTTLLNVPVDPKFRLTLRLYELNLRSADFTIRVVDQATSAVLGTREVRLAFAHLDPRVVLMFNPPYMEIGDISSLVPPGTTLPATLRIEVQPRTEGSEFWTFVSITNNETQHLTLVTPQ